MSETDEEIWIPIQWAKGQYEVSSLGRVRRLDRFIVKRGISTFQKGAIISQSADKDGYMQLSIKVDGRLKKAKGHRLVAECFLPPSEKRSVNHKDGNKANNLPSNLEWVTNKENSHHAVKQGFLNGRTNPNRAKKLTVDMVEAIKRERETGKTYKQIGSIFGIAAQTAHRVVTGSLWGQ